MKYLLHDQESERLVFRAVQESDFPAWLAFHQDPRTSEHWISQKESPERECEKWYEKQRYRYENNLGGMNALVAKEHGRLVGYCGLLVQMVDENIELEIAYSLLPEFWNKGYALEAAKHCKDFAFRHNLAPSLISIISLSNVPSANVARKIGMEIEKTTTYNDNTVHVFRIRSTS
jgi:ribosomal-protein-alanine N-acetyltransferase